MDPAYLVTPRISLEDQMIQYFKEYHKGNCPDLTSKVKECLSLDAEVQEGSKALQHLFYPLSQSQTNSTRIQEITTCALLLINSSLLEIEYDTLLLNLTTYQDYVSQDQFTAFLNGVQNPTLRQALLLDLNNQ